MLKAALVSLVFAATGTSTGTAPTLVLVISVIVGGLFGTAGLGGFFLTRRQNRKLDAETRKMKIEADVLPIDLAKGAVVVQSGVIKDLTDQVNSQEKRIENQQRTIDKHEEAQERSDRVYRKLDKRCSALQEQYAELLLRFNGVLIEKDSLRERLDHCLDDAKAVGQAPV